MARRTTIQRSFRKARRRAGREFRRARRALRRARKALRAAPWSARIVVVALAALILGSAANWLYQVVRKPSELFFPVSGVLHKTPTETWRSYEPLFRRHSTELITPEFLAALAQIEASGNPVARTYWRWRWSSNPLEVYRPASSAVGMYQILDGTFLEARRYCIRAHAVVEVGRWYDPRSCWFNGLYTRVIPSHAVELTSAYLHERVTRTLTRQRIAAATPRQKRDLAGVIHLCGAGAGDAFAKLGFRASPGQRCGSHGVASYLTRLEAMRRIFARLATETRVGRRVVREAPEEARMQIVDKVVVVTGGASGIGRALCERFAREGARGIAVADQNGAGAEAVAKSIGSAALGVGCDVSSAQANEDLVQRTEKAFGPIDLFCCNAGIATGGDPLATPLDVWQRQWDVNLMAHVHALRAALPGMLARGSGHFLHTASMAGILSSHGNLVYAATKHAVVGLAEWLSITYHGRGVRFACLCPLGVRTPMLGDVDSPWAKAAAGPIREPEEVAQAVVDGLASEQFLILTDPQAQAWMDGKAKDPERWLRGMRRIQAELEQARAVPAQTS